MSLRPSNLPKLAVCACYVSNPDAGPAAARGSALDALFRARMQGDLNQAEMFYQPSEDDLAAVEWAVNTLRVLAEDSVVLTREEDCKVVIPGFENPGTADALILDKFAHADLKTGAMRNYREQMAANPVQPGIGHASPRPAAMPQNHSTKQSSRTHGLGAAPEPVPLPEPLENGFLRLLDACFRSDELVAISPAQQNEEGKVAPTRGVTLSREQWKTKVSAKGGIDRCFSTLLGLFIRVNPMKQNGARNDDVTSFRHALVEFDRDEKGEHIPKDVQLGNIVASGLPVSAVIDSGNKSIHAWVRVDAPDASEYKRRVDVIWEWFDGLSLDKQNKNPSRLSRCPDGWRTVDGEKRQQRLLAVNIGSKSWEEWETTHACDDLPKIVAGPEFMATTRPEPPQIIHSILHQGCKMIIGGASKARKSWTLMDMMLAISSGEPWWGFQTQRGRALYINFELPDFAFQHRLGVIASAKGITNYSGFDLWNLRGYARWLLGQRERYRRVTGKPVYGRPKWDCFAWSALLQLLLQLPPME